MHYTLYCRVFNIEECTYRRKIFAGELSTIVDEFVCLDAIKGQAMVKEDIRNVRDCRLVRRNSSSQFGISVCNDKYALATLRCLLNGSQNTYFIKVKGSRRWEEL